VNCRLCDSNRLLSVLDLGVSLARGGFRMSYDLPCVMGSGVEHECRRFGLHHPLSR
jgi:hypothetical protein